MNRKHQTAKKRLLEGWEANKVVDEDEQVGHRFRSRTRGRQTAKQRVLSEANPTKRSRKDKATSLHETTDEKSKTEEEDEVEDFRK